MLSVGQILSCETTRNCSITLVTLSTGRYFSLFICLYLYGYACIPTALKHRRNLCATFNRVFARLLVLISSRIPETAHLFDQGVFSASIIFDYHFECFIIRDGPK